MRAAVMADDVGAIAPHVNAYLLRFYFQVRGMPQPEFMARLNALDRQEQAAAERDCPWLASSEYLRRATVRSLRGTGRPCRQATAHS